MNPLWLLVPLAFGQSNDELPTALRPPVDPFALPAPAPAAPEQPAPDDGVEANVEDGVLVVRVFGPDAIREARQKVIDDMARHGWTISNRRGDDVMFRGPENWMGRAILDAQGTMSFTTPTASFQSVTGDDATAGSTTTPLGTQSPGGDYQGVSRDPGAAIVPQANFAIYPKKKAGVIHERLLAEVSPELASYRDAVQETAFQTELETLTDRLDALWELGIPLHEGDARIEAISDRRLAILAFWASRAATPQGVDTCKAVEEWLSQVVQPSTDPVTATEQEEANARAAHGRQLTLVTGPG